MFRVIKDICLAVDSDTADILLLITEHLLFQTKIVSVLMAVSYFLYWTMFDIVILAIFTNALGRIISAGTTICTSYAIDRILVKILWTIFKRNLKKIQFVNSTTLLITTKRQTRLQTMHKGLALSSTNPYKNWGRRVSRYISVIWTCHVTLDK